MCINNGSRPPCHVHHDFTTIRAELVGSRRCSAFGISLQGQAPVCALARKLIAAGFSADLMLEVYRGPTLCFRVPLGRAARLTVEDSSDGPPRFRPYRPPNVGVEPPAAQTAASRAEGHSGARNGASAEVVR